MSKTRVPDIPAPAAPLCWQQGPLAQGMPRCDRREGHGGRHTWEMAAELEALRELLKQCREWPEYAAETTAPLGVSNHRAALALLADVDAALEAKP